MVLLAGEVHLRGQGLRRARGQLPPVDGLAHVRMVRVSLLVRAEVVRYRIRPWPVLAMLLL